MAVPDVLAVVGSVQNLAVRETKLLCGVMDEIRQIRDAAYDAKNIIEVADYMEKRNRLKKGFMGAISRFAHLPSDFITLHNVGVEIQRVRRKISEIFDSVHRLGIVDFSNAAVEIGGAEDDSSQGRGLLHEGFEEEDVVIGFQDEHEEIVDKLVNPDKNLNIVSIVGIGGIVKTTLRKSVQFTENQ
ncbi:hypothetical protein PR202_gb23860 [Eleusine coracana subsp. coracana]|uniref:Rx N-terminal domain-containing protein n=1 Tax=Eleusine coracana subsp. coracana TaxID=191504 RepID=A0AAV5FJQ3_ELECO|nr:hypothetical protein PR202_gb23860 [Eleusine coracana subsp. coracana]